MKTRLFAVGILIAVLALFPIAVSGEPLETAATSAAGNPLTFVERQFDMECWNILDLVVSPDGANVYVACYSDTVVAFGRDSSSGRFSYVEREQDEVGGVDGLNGASGIALDPDGKNVYVVGRSDNAIAVFDRDPTTGALNFREVHKQGDSLVGGSSIDSLGGASAVIVSADGLYVYVASKVSDAVATFARNPHNGELDYKGAIFDTDSGVDGLDGAWSIVLGSGGDHVYVASEDDSAVAALKREPDGLLSFVQAVKDGDGSVSGLDQVKGVAISSDGEHVYAVSWLDAAVVIFDRDPSTGELDYNDTVWDTDPGVDGLGGASAIALSADGNHVYVASEMDRVVAIFDRDATDGSLTHAGQVGGEGSETGLFSVTAVGVSLDGDHVYGADRDSVSAFDRDAGSGALTWRQTQTSADGLDGAVGVATSPDGDHVYVAGYLDDAVVKFDRDPATGGLTWPADYKDEVGSNDGLAGAVGVALDPDGENVYVAGCDDDAVVVFDRYAFSGALTWQQTITGTGSLNCARAIAVSPDSKHVYVASSGDDAVTIFGRDPNTGELTYAGAVSDGSGPVDGLDGAYALAITADGDYVYVAGYVDDAVTVFERDDTSGALTFKYVYTDTTAALSGLDGANSLALSPDGSYLYVASRVEDAVAVLQRTPATGALFAVQVVRDSDAGVDGLNGARAVAVNPDGSQVYVASQVDNALAVFDRDAVSGQLQYAGMQKDGQAGVDGLNTANGLAVSPEGGHVYVTGYGDDAVAVFARFRVYLPLVVRNY